MIPALLKSKSSQLVVFSFFSFVSCVFCGAVVRVVGVTPNTSASEGLGVIRATLSSNALNISGALTALCFFGMVLCIVIFLIEQIFYWHNNQKGVGKPFARAMYVLSVFMVIASVSSLVCFLVLR